MKLTLKWTALLALAAFPLYSGYSQSVTPPLTPPANAPETTPAASTPAPAPAPAPAPVLGKPTKEIDEVLKLTKAGISEDVVLAYIKNSRGFFSLSADDILHLRDEGISTAVVTAMINHDKTLRSEGFNPTNAQAGTQFPPPGQTVAQPPPVTGGTNVVQVPPLVPGGQSPGQTVGPDGSQPPPPEAETVPVAPGADYYWAPGYWNWDNGWVWVGGIWYPRAWGWGWRGGWGFHGGYHGGGFGRGGGGSHGGGGFGRGR